MTALNAYASSDAAFWSTNEMSDGAFGAHQEGLHRADAKLRHLTETFEADLLSDLLRRSDGVVEAVSYECDAKPCQGPYESSESQDELRLGMAFAGRNGRLGDDAGVGDRVGLPLHGLGEGLVEALVNLSVRLCRRLKLVERRGLFGRPGRLLAGRFYRPVALLHNSIILARLELLNPSGGIIHLRAQLPDTLL